MTPADIKLSIFEIDQAIAATTTDTVSMRMDVKMAQAFKDFLQHMDPDMPPAPICKALGPLVGDYMMNTKLQRLDEIADKLGPAVILLSGLINHQKPR